MESEIGFPSIFSEKAKMRRRPTLVKQEQGSSALSELDVETVAGPDKEGVAGKRFLDLGLSPWILQTCQELGMVAPTPVQWHCIPRILKGQDVLGLAHTGSGKTAAFALPILQKLAENPYGIFALVMTPTRELAFQISEQFKALGSSMSLRCVVVVGGMDITSQAQALMNRPHIVIATPGRLRDHLVSDPDMVRYFSKAQFLVLDEADRLLDVGFEGELRVAFQSLPANRQTLLFSATMTGNLKALHDMSRQKAFFYRGVEGLETVVTLKQQYIFAPAAVKDVYLLHLLANLDEESIRSVMIFVGKCRTCHLLSLILEQFDIDTTALHSMKQQQQRLMSLSRFKAAQVRILIATDVASRGLDIPTVDLVINYDIPRLARDYVHRVGRTARAGRGGWAVSLVTQYDVELIHQVEAAVGKQLEEYKTEEDAVLKGITKVYKAKKTAKLKMIDSGFEEKVKKRKEINRKGLQHGNRGRAEKLKSDRKRSLQSSKGDTA